MKWFGRQQSSNVEDRRGFGRTGLALGGGGGIIGLILALVFGFDPTSVQVPDGGQTRPNREVARSADPAEDRLAEFSKVVFRDTEVVWGEQFQRIGKSYQEPTLVLFSGAVRSACGSANSAVGPFYCPGDSKVYIDLSFYRDMERKLEIPGDFARAYVLAHEVGHHVQHLLGYTRGRSRDNETSVRLELQADFLAGVWAHHAQQKFNFLEEGDLDEAMNAAFQIGDDRLQKKQQGYVVPDSFTHGSSQQRLAAFQQGYESGDLRLARRYFDSSDLGE